METNTPFRIMITRPGSLGSLIIDERITEEEARFIQRLVQERIDARAVEQRVVDELVRAPIH